MAHDQIKKRKDTIQNIYKNPFPQSRGHSQGISQIPKRKLEPIENETDEDPKQAFSKFLRKNNNRSPIGSKFDNAANRYQKEVSKQSPYN